MKKNIILPAIGILLAITVPVWTQDLEVSEFIAINVKDPAPNTLVVSRQGTVKKMVTRALPPVGEKFTNIGGGT